MAAEKKYSGLFAVFDMDDTLIRTTEFRGQDVRGVSSEFFVKGSLEFMKHMQENGALIGVVSHSTNTDNIEIMKSALAAAGVKLDSLVTLDMLYDEKYPKGKIITPEGETIEVETITPEESKARLEMVLKEIGLIPHSTDTADIDNALAEVRMTLDSFVMISKVYNEKYPEGELITAEEARDRCRGILEESGKGSNAKMAVMSFKQMGIDPSRYNILVVGDGHEDLLFSKHIIDNLGVKSVAACHMTAALTGTVPEGQLAMLAARVKRAEEVKTDLAALEDDRFSVHSANSFDEVREVVEKRFCEVAKEPEKEVEQKPEQVQQTEVSKLEERRNSQTLSGGMPPARFSPGRPASPSPFIRPASPAIACR